MTRPLLILPCRAGSERLSKKNIRSSPGFPRGLAHRKLSQLRESGDVFDILLSTNDPDIVNVGLESRLPNLSIDWRPENLCRSDTPLEALVRYFGALARGRICIWTHVTSPFLNLDDYKVALATFSRKQRAGEADSLASVRIVREFTMFRGKPINFGGDVGWPRTQDLEEIQILTSGVFVAPAELMESSGNRLGRSPFFWELDDLKAVDIDSPMDFRIASMLAEEERGIG